MAFPTTITINGATYTREDCSDGLVYRMSGVNNPHVTIHGVKSADYDAWLRCGGYHLQYTSMGGLWEYNAGAPDPFQTQSGKKTTNRTSAEEPQANQLAKDFWAAIQPA